jgi:hypothetical protein
MTAFEQRALFVGHVTTLIHDEVPDAVVRWFRRDGITTCEATIVRGSRFPHHDGRKCYGLTRSWLDGEITAYAFGHREARMFAHEIAETLKSAPEAA